ncbi:MAG TPA: ABC transporter permease subunit, partial [Inquilinus sp.]
FTTWDILRNLLLAARWTVALSLIAFLGGFLLGAGLLLLRLSGRRWARRATGLYVQLFQGTPLLIQLFLCFFGLALIGLDLPPLAAAAVALTLYAAAFLSEIWRGAVEAVPRGQWEAARALALSWPQQLRLVILPQALRVAIAPTVGFLVQVVKPVMPSPADAGTGAGQPGPTAGAGRWRGPDRSRRPGDRSRS